MCTARASSFTRSACLLSLSHVASCSAPVLKSNYGQHQPQPTRRLIVKGYPQSKPPHAASCSAPVPKLKYGQPQPQPTRRLIVQGYPQSKPPHAASCRAPATKLGFRNSNLNTILG